VDDNVDAYGRIYPSPTTTPETEEISTEWAEYVHPDLRQQFESATATVLGDLLQLESGDSIRIKATNIDAWLSTLNQGRLALAARFEVTDADMDQTMSKPVESERDFALFQIHLYGFIQECLIRCLDDNFASDDQDQHDQPQE
jgi:hypothetical protein